MGLTLIDRKMSRISTSASPNAKTVSSVSKLVKLNDLSAVTALAAACSATKALLNALVKYLVHGRLSMDREVKPTPPEH
jgi:hypothetical protein